MKKNPIYQDNEIPDKPLRLFLKGVRSLIAKFLKVDPDTIYIDAAYSPGQGKDINCMVIFPRVKEDSADALEIRRRVKIFARDQGMDLYAGGSANNPGIFVVGPEDADSSGPHGAESVLGIVIPVTEMNKIKLNPRKNPSHFRNDDFQIHTWFERDRAHVELRNETTGETVIEWWDEEVAQAIEDGFLDPRNWKKSALEYANSHNLIWKENRVKKSNPIGNSELRKCALALKVLNEQPSLAKMINSNILAALKAEKLWSEQNGVSKEGLALIKSVGLT